MNMFLYYDLELKDAVIMLSISFPHDTYERDNNR